MSEKKREVPAIEGGAPVRSSVLPFFRPTIDETDVSGVAETVRSGWLTLGPVTDAFEREIVRYVGAPHAVAVSSCSAAMFLALKAMGIGPSDEVVTSANTFASTVHAIVHTGARPVLADIDPDTFCVTPEELVRKTTARTRAYIPVHFGGQACRIGEILDEARRRGIRVLEDAAHSFGASAGGRRIGSFGDAAAFSFYATKNITTGEGGCLTTVDEDFAERVRFLSYHGMSHDSWARYADRGSWYYEVTVPGYKYNMSDILSSLGLTQMRKVDAMLSRRRELAARFISRLDGSPFFELPRVHPGNEHTWHLFVIRLRKDAMGIGRDDVIRALAAENIGCSVHFIPIYKHPFFGDYVEKDESFPVCEDYFSRCISLPLFPTMRDGDVDDVVRALERIAAYYAKDRWK
jgi:dTDP-4-amino-4,6-dideoxygalactose transaminase